MICLFGLEFDNKCNNRRVEVLAVAGKMDLRHMDLSVPWFTIVEVVVRNVHFQQFPLGTRNSSTLFRGGLLPPLPPNFESPLSNVLL